MPIDENFKETLRDHKIIIHQPQLQYFLVMVSRTRCDGINPVVPFSFAFGPSTHHKNQTARIPSSDYISREEEDLRNT